MGATAVQVAATLGAGRVVAAARADERLGRLTDRGADSVVDLDGEDDLARAFQEAANGGVDVIIDPLWGPPAVAAMTAAAHRARHVQIGNLAAATLDLPATRVRSSALNIMGFAVFHAPISQRVRVSVVEHRHGRYRGRLPRARGHPAGGTAPGGVRRAAASENIADAVVYIVTRDRRVAVNGVQARAAEQSWQPHQGASVPLPDRRRHAASRR